MSDTPTPAPQTDAVERDRYGLDVIERGDCAYLGRVATTAPAERGDRVARAGLKVIEAMRAHIDKITAERDTDREDAIMLRRIAQYLRETATLGYTSDIPAADVIMQVHQMHCARIDELLASEAALRARMDELTASNDVLRIERDSSTHAAKHNASTAMTFHTQRDQATAEITRLRAALEILRKGHCDIVSPVMEYVDQTASYCRMVSKLAIQEADTALAPTPDTHNSPGEGDHIKRDEAGR